MAYACSFLHEPDFCWHNYSKLRGFTSCFCPPARPTPCPVPHFPQSLDGMFSKCPCMLCIPDWTLQWHSWLIAYWQFSWSRVLYTNLARKENFCSKYTSLGKTQLYWLKPYLLTVLNVWSHITIFIFITALFFTFTNFKASADYGTSWQEETSGNSSFQFWYWQCQDLQVNWLSYWNLPSTWQKHDTPHSAFCLNTIMKFTFTRCDLLL